MRVTVFIEDDDGVRRSWDVFHVNDLKWKVIDVDDRLGSIGRLTVEGAFHRRERGPQEVTRGDFSG